MTQSSPPNTSYWIHNLDLNIHLYVLSKYINLSLPRMYLPFSLQFIKFINYQETLILNSYMILKRKLAFLIVAFCLLRSTDFDLKDKEDKLGFFINNLNVISMCFFLEIQTCKQQNDEETQETGVREPFISQNQHSINELDNEGIII